MGALRKAIRVGVGTGRARYSTSQLTKSDWTGQEDMLMAWRGLFQNLSAADAWLVRLEDVGMIVLQSGSGCLRSMTVEQRSVSVVLANFCTLWLSRLFCLVLQATVRTSAHSEFALDYLFCSISRSFRFPGINGCARRSRETETQVDR